MSNMIDPSPTTPMEAEEARKKYKAEVIVNLFREQSEIISDALKAGKGRMFEIYAPGNDRDFMPEVGKVVEMLKDHFGKVGWEVGSEVLDRGYRYPWYRLHFNLPGTRANKNRIFAIVAAAIMLAGAVFGGVAAYPHAKAKLFSGKAVAVEKSELELAALIKQGNFSYIDSDITAENFPDPPGGEASPIAGERSFKVYHFNRSISSEDAIKEMEKDGYRPANLRELIAYSQNKWNGEDWVVALGQTWRDALRLRCVPYLYFRGKRELRLCWCGCGWGSGCRFLAVRNS